MHPLRLNNFPARIELIFRTFEEVAYTAFPNPKLTPSLILKEGC